LETTKLAALSTFEKKKYDEVVKTIADFKAHQESINAFVKDTVMANFKEFAFFTCDDGILGECMLIPARYVGESTAPIFYFFEDGIRQKKE